MADFSEHPVIKQHVELYRTDPERAHLWDSAPSGGPGPVPTLLLTTTGRRSGRPRATPLIYGDAGGSYVVIASKAGMQSHPLWYRNLEANPACELMVGPKAVSARARVAEGDERERLWRQMAKLYPPYDRYQERAGARTIPLLVLDPVG
jgi:deazaflavin-dependent oxidoreductase (nitroreductase family)